MLKSEKLMLMILKEDHWDKDLMLKDFQQLNSGQVVIKYFFFKIYILGMKSDASAVTYDGTRDEDPLTEWAIGKIYH